MFNSFHGFLTPHWPSLIVSACLKTQSNNWRSGPRPPPYYRSPQVDSQEVDKRVGGTGGGLCHLDENVQTLLALTRDAPRSSSEPQNQRACMGKNLSCTQMCTVKPVYSDHARSWTSLVVMDMWSLYTGKLYRENARGSTRITGR
jgi:hypothetical protein